MICPLSCSFWKIMCLLRLMRMPSFISKSIFLSLTFSLDISIFLSFLECFLCGLFQFTQYYFLCFPKFLSLLSNLLFLSTLLYSFLPSPLHPASLPFSHLLFFPFPFHLSPFLSSLEPLVFSYIFSPFLSILFFSIVYIISPLLIVVPFILPCLFSRIQLQTNKNTNSGLQIGSWTFQ